MTASEKPACQHPLNKLLWYDGALFCFGCNAIWDKKYPFGLKAKVWGPVRVEDLPHDFEI